MKKLIVFTLCLLVLVGCSSKKPQSAALTDKQKVEMKSNQKRYQKRLKNVPVIESGEMQKALTTVPTGYNDENMNLKALKKANRYVVVAQVLNLTPMIGMSIAPETKATLYIKKVIGGDQKLLGKTVKTTFSGGLAQVKDLYTSYGFKDPKKIVYYPSETFPIPAIKTTVIMGLGNFLPENQGQRKTYQKFGLTTKNYYPITNSETTFWIKKNGKFQLNNPAFYENKAAKKYPNILKVTAQLNQLEK
ncbi:hypothetical protein EGT49_01330 [Companilactobacillus suantsaicola]|uniref:Lipoprotein n=1 Tax=Companilactobacillus suantsaicola TaxID=2487723 RepID=A0A4Z0JRN2_9LACO|nr:hypothetical protein [Companilactobacillus suantsaicola]TGD25125.1 hypothetical protein EGT49_01330 [Companilactobacillus suantsaicola]